MKVLIIEDEQPAVERLAMLLHNYDSSIEIVGCLDSIEETIGFLETHPHPDLLLLDIHLADGHSFEIFRKVQYTRPVIFITAHDRYALDAFKLMSIDYVLKPVSSASLYKALDKYRAFSHSFSVAPLSVHAAVSRSRYKERFLGKVGQRLFFINIDQVAFFEANNKIVHLVDVLGNRYIIDYRMEQLTELLDPALFFRLNRSYIVHSKAIQQVKPFHNSRLRLTVTGAAAQAEMVIARERVSEFRVWADA